MARSMGLLYLSLILFSFFTIAIADHDDKIPAYLLPPAGLDRHYYKKSCPKMEAIIQRKVKQLLKDDYTYGASLIRLHFHDCAIRGCDASILLDIPTTSEKYADVSKTLRGYEFIDDVKAAIEEKCPKIVSCADILTAVARDAAHTIGAPYWSLEYGRKDGDISILEEANVVPMGRESVTDLIQFFQALGLSPVDLVALQGVHTIGRAQCKSFKQRLYNYKDNCADTTLNDHYLNYLQRRCSADSVYTDLDGTTPEIFDNDYYKNLQKGMGLLETDQKMWVDSRTGPLVKAFANENRNLFFSQFAVGMVKLSRTNVLTNNEGEVRLKCSVVN